jgi:hypothetical protein
MGLLGIPLYLKVIGIGIVLILGVFAIAAFVNAAKTASGPVVRVIQWMVGHTPGQKPSDIVAGISFGARILVWAAVISSVIWFFFG